MVRPKQESRAPGLDLEQLPSRPQAAVFETLGNGGNVVKGKGSRFSGGASHPLVSLRRQ
jgi:hypothetical protein